MHKSNKDNRYRKICSALIERWLEGTITNLEFDDQWPWNSADPGVLDIGKELWRYYDDFDESTLTPQTLSEEQRTILERCARFLKSDEPYQPLQKQNSHRSRLRSLISRIFGSMMELVVDDERKKWWPYADRNQFSKGK